MATPANNQTDPGAERARVVTAGRITALVLIGLAAFCLAYLYVGSGDSAVSVPSGAKAGDLTLEPCSYGTEDGSYDADCGTLVVPENRHQPGSRLIALPVTRIRARSQDPAEPVFRLMGGPGLTNMTFTEASRFADGHDVVVVGYRGVDGSSVLDCPEVESALKRSTDFLGEKSFRAHADGLRACATRLRGDGVDLAGYSLPQRVDDLEAARKALGYDRIDLLSESAGTRTALIYAWRYPRSIHRSVMIGVNPPGHFLWDPKTTDEQIGRYAALCSEDASCSKRTDDLAASMKRTASDMPDRWFFLPIEEGNVRNASFWGLMESTPENAPLSSPMTLGSWLSAEAGDPSGFWFMSLLADIAFPTELGVWGDYAAVAREDASVAERHFSSGESDRGSILGNPGTDFIWAGGELVDAWPVNPDENAYARVRTSNVETLLINGELDFATPPQVAKELLPYLENGHAVVLPGFGHSTTFWEEQPEAGTGLINTFLASGRVDDSLYEPQGVDFTPEVTQATIAKIIAGSIVGLAALAVLSLLWMGHRRGRFGRKASATLRSLYAVMLGIGGWCFGALIVMTTLPGVPLDDELLGVLSVGVPVGLGIYFAWVDRDWSARTKTMGFAAAAGGALLGAWLGFTVTEGLIAVLTTVLGAVTVANFTLLALDIAWDRRAHDRFAEAAANQMLEARPSTH